MEQKDAVKWMDTIMSIPGMNEAVKVDLKISRKNVLIVSAIIEYGLGAKGNDRPALLQALQKAEVELISTIAEDLLAKSGLKEFSEKLKSL